MSYCRGNYYIWGDRKNINFKKEYERVFWSVSNELLNVWLSKLVKRKKEFKQRVKEGKKLLKKSGGKKI